MQLSYRNEWGLGLPVQLEEELVFEGYAALGRATQQILFDQGQGKYIAGQAAFRR